MDMFFVTDESDRYLHLYKYADNLAVGNQLTSAAEDFGWVEKTKLLLWWRCIVNEKQLGQKALPIITINTLNKDLANYIKSGSGTLKLYSDPGLSRINDNSMTMFQFLFIYKEEGGSILLGKGYQSNYQTIQRDILGWVSKDIVQRWADRVCLEPNSDEDAAAERKSANIKASLFGNKSDALSWKNGGTPDAVWFDDQYSNHLNAYTKRFPILSNDNGLVNTGTVTDIIDKSGDPIVKKRRHDSLDQELNRKLTNIRTVNVVFVIDAGSGLKEYVSSVATAIQRIADDQANRMAQSNNGDNNNDNYRYGAVVYRDFMDGSCGASDNSIAKYDLTSNNVPGLVGWLGQQADVQGCKGVNAWSKPGIKNAWAEQQRPK
jgi:hypothetical protein